MSRSLRPPYHPTLRDFGRRNLMSQKLRGLVFTGLIGTTSYGSMWANQWSPTWNAMQFAQAERVGANLVKHVINVHLFASGGQSREQFETRLRGWLAEASRRFEYIYFALGDANGAELITLDQRIEACSWVASILDEYPAVVGLDCLNEIGDQVPALTGESGYTTGNQTFLNELFAGVRERTSKPLSASILTGSRDNLTESNAWATGVVEAGADFLDAHLYFSAGDNPTVSDLDAYSEIAPELPIFTGEVGTFLGWEFNTRITHERTYALGDLFDHPQYAGCVMFASNDWAAETFGEGLFTAADPGEERTWVSYPYRTWRRTRHPRVHRSIPLVAAPVDLTASWATVATTLIDPATGNPEQGTPVYEASATFGSGLAQADPAQVRLIDADTSEVLSGPATAIIPGSATGKPASYADSSGGSHTGAPTGPIAVVAGTFSNAALLGQGAYIDFGDLSIAGAGSIECRIQPPHPRAAGSRQIVGKFLPDSSQFEYVLWLEGSNQLIGVLNTAAGAKFVVYPDSLSHDTIHAIEMSWDGTTLRLFVDGALVASTLAGNCIGGTSTATRVGADAAGGGQAAGLLIDELRISTTARHTSAYTPAASAFTTDGSTLLLVHFNEATTGTVTTTTVVRATTRRIWRPGPINAALQVRNAAGARGKLLNAALDEFHT